MTEPRHRFQGPLEGLHVIHRYVFEDAADRVAFTNEQSGNIYNTVTPTAADVGSVAFQEDDLTFWILTDHAPLTWLELGGGGGGSGDVVGPASSTDNAVALFDGLTGKLLQDSVVTIDPVSGNIATPGTVDGRNVSADGTTLDGLLARNLIAGAGLTGGGTLAADRTFDVDFGAVAGTVCEGDDARLSDSRPPNGAAAGDLAGTYPAPTIALLAVTAAKIALATITDAQVAAANKDGLAATASMRTLGTGATQAAAGNDARFTDSRAPNGPAGGDLTGTYPDPTIALLAVTAAKIANLTITAAKIANATLTDVQFAAANIDGLAAVASLRTLGTGAQQSAAGNDARFTDSRAPNGPAGGDLAGTYPDPTIALLAVTAAKIALATITDAQVAAANKDGVAATPSMRTLGTGAAQACAGNDTRLSDSRAPNGAAAGDLTGTYPAPTIALLAVTAAKIALATITDAQVAAANKDGLAATASMRTLGTGATQAAAGNDTRITGAVQTSTLTTDGDLYARVAGNVTRLGLGLTGQALRNVAGTLGWAFPIDLRYDTQFYTDFIEPVASTGLTISGYTATGSFRSFTRTGVVQQNSVAVGVGVMSTNTGHLVMGGPAVMRVGFLSPSAVSDATDNYTVYLGLNTLLTTGEGTDTIELRYNHAVNSGRWQGVCRNTSVETAVDTGVAFAADTWYDVEWRSNAAGTSVDFLINNVAAGTVATNVPAAGRTMGIVVKFDRTAGTNSRISAFDYVSFHKMVSR